MLIEITKCDRSTEYAEYKKVKCFLLAFFSTELCENGMHIYRTHTYIYIYVVDACAFGHEVIQNRLHSYRYISITYANFCECELTFKCARRSFTRARTRLPESIAILHSKLKGKKLTRHIAAHR